MSYTIKRTDGTTLLTLSDSRVDQLSTSISLIGKNVDSYGEYYNNNLVGLLENFATDGQQPRSPLVGQLWFNRVDGRMYVYGVDNLFKPVAATQVSTTQPTNVNQGDLWIDTVKKQLWFTPDGTNFTLAGPQYSTVSGKSGWLVETIVDTGKNEQIVASLYNKNTLLGIVSSTVFNFEVPQNGMTHVDVGFNLNQSIPGIRFVGTATSADSVQGFTPGDYITRIGDQTLYGQLTVLNDNGLYVGGAQQLHLYVDSNLVTKVDHTVIDKTLLFRGASSSVGGSSVVWTALALKSDTQRVGILTETPQYPLDVLGDTRIQGNLIVVGTSTNVQSVNLQVNDKNIELAYGNNLDSVASGGGITLHGTTDHTITWSNNGTGWNFNTNTNITSTLSSIMIGGNVVVQATRLGTAITAAPGMKTLGILDHLTVTNVTISGSTVAATGTNVTLHLAGTGSGTVDVDNYRVSSVATCIDPADATNKDYVDTGLRLVGTKGFAISIDVTSMVDPDTEIIVYLNKLFPITNPPPYEYLNITAGTRVRVLCSTISLAIPASPAQLATVAEGHAQVVDTSNVTRTVVTQGISVTIPSSTIITPTISYLVRQYFVTPGLVWQIDPINPIIY